MIHVSFQGTTETVSEETRHTILLYHQVSRFPLFIIALLTFSVCDRCHQAATAVRSQGTVGKAWSSRRGLAEILGASHTFDIYRHQICRENAPHNR